MGCTDLAQNVEQEGVDVVVKGLVVQEELGQGAQVLPVLLLLPAIHLEHRQVAVPVDLPRERRKSKSKSKGWREDGGSHPSIETVDRGIIVPISSTSCDRTGRTGETPFLSLSAYRSTVR